jgi:hypothetical protein
MLLNKLIFDSWVSRMCQVHSYDMETAFPQFIHKKTEIYKGIWNLPIFTPLTGKSRTIQFQVASSFNYIEFISPLSVTAWICSSWAFGRMKMLYVVEACQELQAYSHLDEWVGKHKQHLLPLHGPVHRAIKLQNVLSLSFLNEQPVPKESLKRKGRLYTEPQNHSKAN